jgi:hypothetical protein
MSFAQKLLVSSGFVLLLAVIGVTDGLVTRPDLKAPLLAAQPTDSFDAQDQQDTLPADPQVTGTGASSGAGVQKQDGPDVFDVLNGKLIVTEVTSEQSLIGRILPAGSKVDSRVLLKQDDRIAYLAWIDAPDVKSVFSALKEALHSSFSPQMKDLVDETQQPDGHPVRNVLSFFDPAIHEDRLLFVRVRQRLYEFHVTPGKEQEVQDLMNALTE